MSEIQRYASMATGVITRELAGGFLRDIAEAKVEAMPNDVTPEEVAAIIVPEPAPTTGSGVVLEPRWTLVDQAEAATPVKNKIAENTERILSVAFTLGMRKLVEVERQPEATGLIEPENALFVVEGGGNKTSVVRRGVAEKAMREVYGDYLHDNWLIQVGTGREIPVTRNDKPNAEHRIIRELAEGFLPQKNPFTEFEANVATAKADGYKLDRVDRIRRPFLVSRMVSLVHPDPSRPKLAQLQPTGPRFDEAYDALRGMIGTKQLVVATNGQYRPKMRLQTVLRAWHRGEVTPSVVSLGDEPGDKFNFAGSEMTTPDRPAAAYINDMVILGRLAQRLLDSRG